MEPPGRYNQMMYIADQFILNLGLIYSILLFIIVGIKYRKYKQSANSNTNKHTKTKTEFFMKLSLLTIFISNITDILSFWSIVNLNSIIPKYNHSRNLTICHTQHIVASLCVGCYLCSILIYFSLRLEIMLGQTPYQYSSKTYLIYRITVIVTIMTLGATSSASYAGSYNVYVPSMDVIVCSGVESTQLTTMKLVIGGGLFWTFILNVIIWYMFYKRLITIIQSKHVHTRIEASKSGQLSNSATCTDTNSDGSIVVFDEYQLALLGVIKKQTLLVGIICLSTITFWGIHSLFLYGYFCLICDAVVNISCIFLSLVFTKDFYERLGCERLSDKCCGCVERYAIVKVMDGIHASTELETQSNTSRCTNA